jgi:hypothetical protein
LCKDDFELNARCGCDEYTVNSTLSVVNIPSKEISVRKFIVTFAGKWRLISYFSNKTSLIVGVDSFLCAHPHHRKGLGNNSEYHPVALSM